MIKAFRADKSATLVKQFMDRWYREDGFNYLFETLLECTDMKSRKNAMTLMKYVLVALKMHEKEYLLEPEDFEVEGDDGKKLVMQRYRSLCTRFLDTALNRLNTQVAKNWSRFEQFLDMLYFLALADQKDIDLLGED